MEGERVLWSHDGGFHLVLCDADDAGVAVHSILLVWDGSRENLSSGIDGVLERGVGQAQRGDVPTILLLIDGEVLASG